MSVGRIENYLDFRRLFRRTFVRQGMTMWIPRTASIRLGQCIRQTKPLRQRRLLHMVLKLPYENLEPHVNGIYPLYSKEGFNIAWTERQHSLIEQVNKITQGV
jgi:hypothetical protein